jgi:hypothetical protein
MMTPMGDSSQKNLNLGIKPDDVWAPIAGEPVMGRLKVK